MILVERAAPSKDMHSAINHCNGVSIVISGTPEFKKRLGKRKNFFCILASIHNDIREADLIVGAEGSSNHEITEKVVLGLPLDGPGR